MEKTLSKIKELVENSKDNKIYVVGKGPSLNKLDKDLLKEGIVINLNDSERFYAGHIGILHSFWAHHSVEKNGFKAGFYLTDREMSSDVANDKIPFIPHNLGHFDSFGDLENQGLYISDFLFISALKLGMLIADAAGKKMEVVFIGFDFGSIKGKGGVEDFSGYTSEFTNVMFKTQEDIFVRLKTYVEDHLDTVSITHVGEKEYSDISLGQFNRGSLAPNKNLKDNNQLYQELMLKLEKDLPIFVAELTNNHIGDERRLRKMIRMSKEQGADAIKVQKRDVATFYTPEELKSPYKSPFGDTLKDYRENVELTEHLFDVLIEECKRNEIFWFASVLDKNSYEYMLKFDLPLIKLPSTISNHRNYLKHVAETFKGDVVVSTGFTDQEYEQFVLDLFSGDYRLFLLQCTSSYPAPPDSCNIGVIHHYSELRKTYTNLVPGYSSHDVGALASQIAIGAGALMLEKHVKLGNLDWVHFDGVALDISKNEFNKYVNDVKLATTIKGSKTKEIHDKEHHKYKVNKFNN